MTQTEDDSLASGAEVGQMSRPSQKGPSLEWPETMDNPQDDEFTNLEDEAGAIVNEILAHHVGY
jgi:hypothetical protein